MPPSAEQIEKQIFEEQQTVDYDIKEYPLEVISDKYQKGIAEDENDIFIPSYQRAFVWKDDRQSKFIESIILGLPIPYIFVAQGADGRFEVIDGSQRIRTVTRFLNDDLVLSNLSVLDKCNGLKFSDFPGSRQKKIKSGSMRMIVLSEHSSEDARFMLFERINTGSELLNQIEKKLGIHQGRFSTFIVSLKSNVKFRKITRFTQLSEKRKEPEELLLRFFALANNLENYSGNLDGFLTDFIVKANKKFDRKALLQQFNIMADFVIENFPNGFAKNSTQKSIPRARFEAIAVGIIKAYETKPLPKKTPTAWAYTTDFEKHVSGTSLNSKSKVVDRINFVKDKLLGN